jgi:serine/threonine-protein kinase
LARESRRAIVLGGKYRLLEPIGVGGMGQVWTARNEITEREFAIKLLLPQAATNPRVVARFVQEAKVSGRLRHPGILEIYDVGTAPELGGAPFLVMELLQGVPLQAAIRSLGGLPLRFTLLVAIAVTRALGAAHDKGVVHRDLKPANVFLHRGESGAVVPKLLDFGISKLVSTEPDSSDALGLTQTGSWLGSPRFMSPEQMSAVKDIDGRSDIHALGVLVWWCLTARSPFTAVGLHELLLEVVSAHRPRLRDGFPDAPPGVCDFVSRAFAPKREDRYQSAADALEVLEQELVKLGPGPTLESPDWVAELLSRVAVPPAPKVTVPLAVPDPIGGFTTHGAVSVSLHPPQPALASTAARTVDGASSGSESNVAPRRRVGRTRVAAFGLAGLVVVVAAGMAIAIRSYQRAPGASTAVASTAAAATVTLAPSVPSSAAQLAASPAPSTVPWQPPSSVADAGVARSTPLATAPPRSAPLVTTRGAMRGRPAATTNPDDPFRGVTGSGL